MTETRKRQEVTLVRLSKEEDAVIGSAAEIKGLTKASWIRSASFEASKKVVAKAQPPRANKK